MTIDKLNEHEVKMIQDSLKRARDKQAACLKLAEEAAEDGLIFAAYADRLEARLKEVARET